MSKLTDAEIKTLENAETVERWNSICDEIKKNHNGWPSDWAEKVLFGNLKSNLDLSIHIKTKTAQKH